MNLTIEEQLEQAKALAQDAEKKRIQLETKLEAAQARKAELLDKCVALGVTPDQLPDKITELEANITKGMSELQRLLPTDELAAAETSDDDMPF